MLVSKPHYIFTVVMITEMRPNEMLSLIMIQVIKVRMQGEGVLIISK